MGLFKLFKTKPDEITIEPATTGRVLKETSELKLEPSEREILLDLYQTIMSLDDQENRLTFISYLSRLILDLPLTPVEDPIQTDEYIAHTNNRLQSSRCKSLWTYDAGQTWYDIDNDMTSHKFYRWIYKKVFDSSSNAPKFITKRMLPYVSFPYIKNITESYLK